VAKLVDAKVG